MKTDWKEDILAPSMQGKRRYHVYENEDASISLIDSTEYDQVGDVFGATELNQIGEEINNTVDMLTSAVQTAQASSESAQESAERAMQGTPEGYAQFVSSTESHLSTLDKSVGNHENLLDNPWFTVNQRGQSEYTGSGSKLFTVDRWALANYNTDSKVIINNDGSITLTAPTSGKQNKFFQQFSYDYLSKFIEKTLTLSIMLGDGSIKSITIPNFDISQDLTHRITIDNNVFCCDLRIYPPSDDYHVRIFKNRSSDIGNITFKAVKLELGTVSTIANDAPPNYELEKYKCIMSTADPSDTYANGGMIKGTLSAGSTSVTLTDSRITTDATYDIYASKFGIAPTAVTVNNGSMILTFDKQTEPITVGVKIV